MAYIIAPGVRDTTTTTGTGTVTLANSAPLWHQTFGAVCATNDVISYRIEHATLNEWEEGYGTYNSTGPTLARTIITASSNAGAAVNFSAGTKNVYSPAIASMFKPPTRQIFTASGTWNKPLGLRFARMWALGGGGGGGGATAAASQVSAAGGGAAGSYVEEQYDGFVLASSVTVTIGAAGAGGVAANGLGSAGGATTFGALATAAGGNGGGIMTSGTSVLATIGGIPIASPSSGGDINGRGQGGFPALRTSGTTGIGGCGGSTHLGGAGRGSTTAGVGQAAQANSGSGGAGALSTSATGFAGGAGAAGILVVEEYY